MTPTMKHALVPKMFRKVMETAGWEFILEPKPNLVLMARIKWT